MDHAATIMFCAARPASKSLPVDGRQIAIAAAAAGRCWENLAQAATSSNRFRCLIRMSRVGWVFLELPAIRPA